MMSVIVVIGVHHDGIAMNYPNLMNRLDLS